jgi:hypothetical protein
VGHPADLWAVIAINGSAIVVSYRLAPIGTILAFAVLSATPDNEVCGRVEEEP